MVLAEYFYPSPRAWSVLLSTFVLILICVYRDSLMPEKSTHTHRVRTRLVCGVGHHDAELRC